MMHPNKIHFCAINKRCATEFRLLSDKKNPILLFPQVLAMSFKHHLQMSSLSMFACCGQATELFVGKQYPLQGSLVEWLYAFANTAAEKIHMIPESRAESMPSERMPCWQCNLCSCLPSILSGIHLLIQILLCFFYSCHLLFSSE